MPKPSAPYGLSRIGFFEALILFIASLLPAAGLAQTAQNAAVNPGDLCTIQGVVAKAGTGEPLHKATVEAWPVINRTGNRIGNGDQPQGGSAETDEMGRFEIKGLNPGRYYLSASRNGFVRQQYGQRTPEGQGAILSLSSGETVPVNFQMIPAAVITGHVYDEHGEPVVYVQVMAMHYVYVNGQRQLVVNQNGQTNDLGEFRIFGLSPGQYFVQATRRANQFGNAKSKEGYVPVFYPGASDPSRAAPITVRGGDEFSGVDISLQTVRGLTVKGNVLNAGCGGATQGAMVFLREQTSNQGAVWQNSMRPVNAEGTFEFSNVTPGSYYLYALFTEEGRQCFGRQALEVSDADIEGVTLSVAPGVEIRGHLGVEGQIDSNPGSLIVNLFPKILMMPFGGRPGTPKSDGSFLIKDVADGDYEIYVESLPENSFIKSARLDGVDVLTAGVAVDTKQSPGSLEILVSPNGASVDGAITKDQPPFQGATVAIVPDPPHRGERRLFKSITTDQNGHFIMQGLAPGDYKVFAWEKIEPNAYTSPEYLQPYEHLGESVHITEGSRNSVQVDLIPAKDSGP